MATTAAAFCKFRASPVICSAQQSKPNSANNKPSSTSSSSNWWTPLFGISSNPDYIQSSGSLKMEQSTNTTEISDQFGKPRSKFSLGCFTEEKAKELRKKTMESSNFHDVMYHSAIASRLASDVSSRREY